MKKSFNQVFWFTGGFALGLTLISLGHAALPNRVTPQPATGVSEMKAPKVTAPDLEQDYSKLTNLEGRYAESWDQQERLRSATSGVARADLPPVRVAPRAAKKKARQ
jgi:hypothetical protein